MKNLWSDAFKSFLLVLLIIFLLVIIELLILEVFHGIRRKKVQKAWDDYCKDLSHAERRDVLCEWCKQNQIRTGYKLMYIPIMNNIPCIIHSTIINGEKYRGTVEEIAFQSGYPIEILKNDLDNFGGLRGEYLFDKTHSILKRNTN